MTECPNCKKSYKNLKEHITKKHQKIKIVMEEVDVDWVNNNDANVPKCYYYLNDILQSVMSMEGNVFSDEKNGLIYTTNYIIIKNELIQVYLFEDKTITLHHSAPLSKRKNYDGECNYITLTDKQYEYVYNKKI